MAEAFVIWKSNRATESRDRRMAKELELRRLRGQQLVRGGGPGVAWSSWELARRRRGGGGTGVGALEGGREAGSGAHRLWDGGSESGFELFSVILEPFGLGLCPKSCEELGVRGLAHLPTLLLGAILLTSDRREPCACV